MNREQTIEAVKIMEAWLDGKVVQVGKQEAPWLEPKWTNLGEHVIWDFTSLSIQYRIKPAPLERWIVTDGAGCETLYFHDPRPGLAVLETAAKFVEVMEDEAKPAYDARLPPPMIIPSSLRPLLRPFMKGDKGKTQGGWDYEVVKVDDQTMEVRHSGTTPLRSYEMLHDRTGSAGPAGSDHQLLTPNPFA